MSQLTDGGGGFFFVLEELAVSPLGSNSMELKDSSKGCKGKLSVSHAMLSLKHKVDSQLIGNTNVKKKQMEKQFRIFWLYELFFFVIKDVHDCLNHTSV